VRALFQTQAGELVVALPETGIDPAWLARPLAELGLDAGRSFAAVRVEMPASRRWRTPDAAFFARLLAGSRRRGEGSIERPAAGA
jgi:hypothetical protein